MDNFEVENEGREKLLTLTFFSNIIEKENIKEIKTKVKKWIIENIINSHNLKYVNKEEFKVINTFQNNNNYVENWKIIINPLRISQDNPISYRILLTFQPKLKDIYKNKIMDRNVIENYKKEAPIIKKYMPNGNLIMDLKLDNGRQITLTFNELYLNENVDFAESKILIWGHSRFATKMKDIKNIIRGGSDSIIFNLEEPLSNYKIYFDGSFKNFGLKEKIKDEFTKLGFTVEDKNRDKLLGHGNIDKYSCIFTQLINEEYTKWKIESINKNIISQNIRNEITSKLLNIPQMDYLKLEVLFKLNLRPLELDPTEEPSINDGYIYLGRVYEFIKEGSDDALGAILIYGQRSEETTEKLLTLNDIKSESQHNMDNKENDKNDPKLIYNLNSIDRIVDMFGLSDLQNRKFTILITKRIRKEHAEQIYEKFRNKKIETKIIYLSSFFGKIWSFPESSEETQIINNWKVSYKILDGKFLFYQPSFEIKGLFDFHVISAEIIYPFNEGFTEDDVKSLTRLAKRRLYRIHQINSLRIPEPIAIFRDKAKIIREIKSPIDLIVLI